MLLDSGCYLSSHGDYGCACSRTEQRGVDYAAAAAAAVGARTAGERDLSAAVGAAIGSHVRGVGKGRSGDLMAVDTAVAASV
jgi:hypothetical protein